ncbi:hypothetical protein BO94DRAFT_305200 [Aspergillus sclerotioniger CBS 115572]|uniref:Transcription factor domain-containing protein n=1 Tax=Aspergillus sclerotioniger CBS 115572 TaxID=1450535 RepID=A0A317V3P7_9EURO|nr:hypothetical protein BO94DRAFT_305200 [Aspergillus sclerotioniger CBS 115572]PWY67971.1 hypothetical protein BO94DRAFT_305200 [Aspergillus sclerotioniger CBS 115572]
MSRDHDLGSGTTEYQFVFGKDQPGTRSHAMRQFWRRRHQALQSSVRISRPQLRALLPKEYGSEGGGFQADVAQSQGKSPDPPANNALEPGSRPPNPQPTGIDAAQESKFSILQGPSTKFPIDLSPKNQAIFYSWLDLHTSSTPDTSPNTRFHPIQDVWLPMDLSNSAAFCALMAHASAHVAHLQRQTKSLESEKFRTLAVGIIAKWLADERRSTQDATLAAIARLLMFEKYWAVDDQWRAHRNGLFSVFHARGGLQAFKSDWRLHMVLFLAFSMSEPSRLSSPAHAWEISEYFVPSAVHPAIQLRMVHNKPKSFHGIHIYPEVYDAVLFLRNYTDHPDSPDQNGHLDVQGHKLICLFILVLIMQESLYSSEPELNHSFAYKLPELNNSLYQKRLSWVGSPQKLRELLMGDHTMLGPPTREFIVKLEQNVVYLNEDARGAIEKCLLNTLLWRHESLDAISNLNVVV